MLAKKEVAIYTQGNNAYDIEYSTLYELGFKLIEYKSKEEFINTNTNLKVICSCINEKEAINIIKTIRNKYLKSQVAIIVCLKLNQIKSIQKYIKVGINDYIKVPFTINEMNFRLSSNLKYIDEDSKFQVTIDNLPFQTWVTDIDGVYLHANQKFANHFNTKVDNMIGKSAKDFYDHKEVNIINNENRKLLKKRKTIKYNAKYIDGNSELRSIEVYKTPIFNSYNEVIGITGTMIDITSLKYAEEESKKQALTDPLTTLNNRRALYEYVDKKERYISAILIDVDDFKYINDIYGHSIGDEILISISNRLKKVFDNYFLCRLGGDEFLVILDNTKEKEIIYSKVRDLINKDKLNCDKYDISLSVGIVFNQSSKDINKILNKADIAMYKAKSNGKNTYLEYDDEMGKERASRLEIENCIKKYKDRKDFKLYYQPQYTRDKKIMGLEALLRWDHEKYRNIPISEIIQIMEESNLIIDIGYFIIEKAFKFSNKINNNRKQKIKISINISAIQIMDKNFVENMKSIVYVTNVDTSSICIEITETSLLKDMKKNAIKIKMLKDMGMNISIDDFGTGYSSLSYILGLPIDSIKIDKSIIDLVNEENKYKNIIDLIVKFSQMSNLSVVAEGVEYEEQLEALKEMDIDYFQGYLFNKPLKEEDIIKII